jgi:hypothetical protein
MPSNQPETPATAAQLRVNAQEFRRFAASTQSDLDNEMALPEPSPALVDCYQRGVERNLRAAAALDADAAVEEARERVGHWITRGYADLSRYEHAAIDALITAVEARAVARERGRECVWTAEKRPMSMSLTGVAYRTCTGKVMLLPTEFCPSCGGRLAKENRIKAEV